MPGRRPRLIAVEFVFMGSTVRFRAGANKPRALGLVADAPGACLRVTLLLIPALVRFQPWRA